MACLCVVVGDIAWFVVLVAHLRDTMGMVVEGTTSVPPPDEGGESACWAHLFDDLADAEEGAMRVARLGPADRDVARATFTMMAEVFDEHAGPLSDGYLDRLLRSRDFFALAAIEPAGVVGGITAHTLAMTRSESSELFIYDLAVRADRQRQGIGRLLVDRLKAHARVAGIDVVFVPADDEDVDALDFYRAIGGVPSPVTIFDLPT